LNITYEYDKIDLNDKKTLQSLNKSFGQRVKGYIGYGLSNTIYFEEDDFHSYALLYRVDLINQHYKGIIENVK
jgi:hypothetical protein